MLFRSDTNSVAITNEVEGMVIGGHGDTTMIPLARLATYKGSNQYWYHFPSTSAGLYLLANSMFLYLYN